VLDDEEARVMEMDNGHDGWSLPLDARRSDVSPTATTCGLVDIHEATRAGKR